MTMGQQFQSNLPSRNWIIVGGLLTLVLLGVGLTRVLPMSQGRRSGPEAVATPLPQRVAVAALGRLEPNNEVIRVSGPMGERIGQLRVAKGDWVKAGQVIAVLESYNERLAERNLSASQLAEAERRLQAETQFRQAQVQEARTRIQQVAQPRAFEVEAQQARVWELEANLALAHADRDRAATLYREGAIAQQELDRQETEVRRIEEQLRNARSTLVQLRETRQMDTQNAQAQLQVAQANIPLAQVQTAVDSARQNLRLAEARLDRTLIRAPQDGRVLRILTKAGEAIGNNGIVDLGDTRQMNVVAEVYETDVNLVKVGQRATITSRNGAFPSSLTGEVIEVGWQVFKNDVLDDDPAANADARVVEVKIRLDDSKPVEALTNLQVDVKIDVS
ncbi:HlyD family efflux transporter periplasmic adaptor subunit [Trichothermofontia sp.]